MAVTAIGTYTNANGNLATALGYGAAASATAVALGADAAATGIGGIAIGSASTNPAYGMTTATGNNSIAVGSADITAQGGATTPAAAMAAKAVGNRSIAVGTGASTGADSSIAMGDGAATIANQKNAIAIGTTAKANIASGIAIGANSNVTTARSAAIGDGASTPEGAVATGGTVIRGVTYTFAGANPVGVISFGNANEQRQLKNVAAGQLTALSTDGVNGSQLFQTNQALNSLTAAGTLYFHANSTGQDSVAGGLESVAIGSGATTATAAGYALAIGYGSNAAGAQSIAVGKGASATGGNDTAFGVSATANGTDPAYPATAFGNNSVAKGVATTAFGAAAQATGSYAAAIGYGAKATGDYGFALGAGTSASAASTTAVGGFSQAAAAQTTALGYGAKASASSGTALGYDAVATNANDVALGAESVTGTAVGTTGTTINKQSYTFGGTAPIGVVSVGTGVVGGERLITNVAAGRLTSLSTDAINASQLFYTNSAIDALAGGVVQYDDGNKTSVTLGGVGTATGIKLNNVAAAPLGSTSLSAVNGSQLFTTNTNVSNVANQASNLGMQVASELGGGATYSAVGGLTAPSYTIQGATYNDVGSAFDGVDSNLSTIAATINNISNGGGIRYFHANSTGPDSTASGTDSIAIGSGAQSISPNSITVGLNAAATSVNAGGAVVVGTGANSQVGDSITLGTNASATTYLGNGGGLTMINGETADIIGSVTIGQNASTNVDGSSGIGSAPTAVGESTTASADGTVALGSNASATVVNAVALGTGASASVAESVALGSGSTTAAAVAVPGGTVNGQSVTYAGGAPTGVVSVGGLLPDGSATVVRQITNVAAGQVTASSTDAINGSQLFATNSALGAIGAEADNAVQYDDATTHASVTLHAIGSTAPVKLTNVAKGALGANSTDAVNGSQLFDTNTNVTNVANQATGLGNQIATELGGGSTYSAAGGLTAPSYTIQGSTYNNVGSALGGVDTTLTTIAGDINNISNGAGIKYFHANSTSADSTATGADSIAIGGVANASANSAIALGPNAKATANSAIAIGVGANASFDQSVALGSGSTTSQYVAVPNVSLRGNSYDFWSGTGVIGVVSVGTANGGTRQIQNVAAGQLAAHSTDAVNGSQLFQTNQAINAINTSGPVKYFHVNSSDPDSIAAGDDSIAIGPSATTGPNESDAIAIGAGSSATGTEAVAMGPGATAPGAGAVAIGFNAQTFVDNDAAIGTSAYAQGTDENPATAIGNSAHAIGAGATAFGVSSATADYALAVGFDADAKSGDSTAIGHKSSANGLSSVALGGQSQAASDHTTALGNNSWAVNPGDIAVGYESTTAQVNPTKSGTVGGKSIDYAGGAPTSVVSVGGVLQNDRGTTVVRQITNVAAGQVTSLSTDAINGSQLALTNSAVDALAGNTVQYDDDTRASVTLHAADPTAQVKLTNVAPAALNAGSTDAVNGSQLFATDTNVSNLGTQVATELGGGATYNAASGLTGPTYTIQGSTYNNVGSALGGVDSSLTTIAGTVNNINNGAGIRYFHANSTSPDSTATGTDSVAIGPNAVANNAGDVALGSGSQTGLATATAGATINGQYHDYAGIAPTSVVSVGVPGGERLITNVAAGQVTGTSTDAVNGSQLFATDSALDAIGALADNAVQYDDNTHTQVTLGGAGVPAAVKLTNVSPADLNADSTDAVNGSQLFATNTNVTTVTNQATTMGSQMAQYLGGGSTYSAGGGLTAPVFTLQGVTYNDVGSAFGGVDGAINDIHNDLTGAGIKYFHANSSAPDALADAEESVAIGPNSKAALGDSISIGAGALANASIGDVAIGSNSVTSAPAPTGSFSFVDPNSLPGSTITQTTYTFAGANPTSVISVGGDASGAPPAPTRDPSRQIMNVGAGRISADSEDAVNGSELFATNNAVDQVSNATIQLRVGLADAVKYDGVTNPRTVTFNPGGGQPVRLLNVGPGTGATDAVNFSQLTDTNTAVENLAVEATNLGTDAARILGGGATFTEVGGMSDPTYIVQGQTYTDVGSALGGVNNTLNTISGAITNITAGEGIKYFHVNSTDPDGTATGTNSVAVGPNATAANAGDIALGSGSVTGTTVGTSSGDIDGTTYQYAGGTPTSMLSVGALGSERLITNVAAGRVTLDSTDAVNGSQLFATNQALAAINTVASGGVQYDTANKSIVTLGGVDDGQTVKLTNVGGGAIADGSTDAVNGGQLFSAMAAAKTPYFGANPVVGAAPGAVDPLANLNGEGASGQGSVAAGVAALASGNNATALGQGATATSNNSVALGANSTTQDAVATGSATIQGQVYNFAGVAPVGTVSVGSVGAERTITNVAAGRLATDSTDAVNGSQLNATNTAVNSLNAGVADIGATAVRYDTDGNGNKTNSITLAGGDPNAPVVVANVATGVKETDAVNVGQLNNGVSSAVTQSKSYTDVQFASANSYTDQQIGALNNDTNNKLNQLSSDIGSVRNEARQAAAVGLAAASLRYDDRPGKISVAMGGGQWRGQGAVAFGAGYTNEDGTLRANISGATAGGKWGVGAGLSYTFN